MVFSIKMRIFETCDILRISLPLKFNEIIPISFGNHRVSKDGVSLQHLTGCDYNRTSAIIGVSDIYRFVESIECPATFKICAKFGPNLLD